jgi:hypothetical protein
MFLSGSIEKFGGVNLIGDSVRGASVNRGTSAVAFVAAEPAHTSNAGD